jgi:hypothetical protein
MGQHRRNNQNFQEHEINITPEVLFRSDSLKLHLGLHSTCVTTGRPEIIFIAVIEFGRKARGKETTRKTGT